MHPERIRAAAYGGTSFIHIIPYSRDVKKKVDLIYPIGVSDWAQITGKQFDRDAYLIVPRLLTMGLLDTEDVTRYGGLSPSSMKSWIDSRLGSLETRWNNVTRLLGELGNFESKLYRDKGHTFDWEDYISFLDRYSIYSDNTSASTSSTSIGSSQDGFSEFRIILGNPSVIIKPTIIASPSGHISSIELSYFDKSGKLIEHPETTIRRIQLQLDVKPDSGYPAISTRNPNRAYDSPLISATTVRHELSKTDISVDIIMTLYISYEDLAGNHYLIAYSTQ